MRVCKESSFIYFVYPFAIEPTAVESRVKAIEEATCTVRSGEARRVWEPLNLPHEELIEHMGQYLNLTGDQPATARVWRLSHDAARQFGIDQSTKWRLLCPRGEIGFQFGRGDNLGFAVQLALFHTGVGFLTVQIWLDSVGSGKLDEPAPLLSVRTGATRRFGARRATNGRATPCGKFQSPACGREPRHSICERSGGVAETAS
jgi:hypothetical protein